MRDSLKVTEVDFMPANAAARATGLLGYARVVLNDWITVEGVTVRRTREGRLVLSFPIRTDQRGARHGVAYPANRLARDSIEGQVIARLCEMGYVL